MAANSTSPNSAPGKVCRPAALDFNLFRQFPAKCAKNLNLFAIRTIRGADQFAFGSAKNADDRLIFDADNRALHFDADGAGGMDAVLIAHFGDTMHLGAGDILVV